MERKEEGETERGRGASRNAKGEARGGRKSTSAARKKKWSLTGERKKRPGGMRTVIASGLVETERETRRAGWYEHGRTNDGTTPAGAGEKGRTYARVSNDFEESAEKRLASRSNE